MMERPIDKIVRLVIEAEAEKLTTALRAELENAQERYTQLYQENKRLTFWIEQQEDHDGPAST